MMSPTQPAVSGVALIRVLLVEDNATDALVARDELAHAVGLSFEVVTVERLSLALTCLETQAFDVVLLDLSLPDSEGMETYLRLRAAAPLRPVVVLSHRDDEALALAAVQAGAQDYLIKGHAEGLLRAISYAVERSRAASALQNSEMRLAGMIDSAMDAVISMDGRHRIIVFNRAAEFMFGRSAAEMLGQTLDRLLPTFARFQHAQQVEQFGHTGVTARAMVGSGSSGLLVALRANGEEFPISASISKVRVAGELIVTAIVRDESDRERAREEIEAVNRDLERSNAALQQIAHFDALTGLPTRVLLAELLQPAILRCGGVGQGLAVAFLDLDGFKPINDTHGHVLGDDLLVAVAERIKGTLREGDFLARIGGDEFVAVLLGINSARDCEPILAALLEAVAGLSMVGGAKIQVTASVGVTLCPPDAEDADTLVRHADQAMYLAKQGGRNRFHFFDNAQAQAVQSQRESLAQVRRALDQGEFVLHYQPKVNMRSGVVVGVEALIRWQHPERGLLPPGAFLSTFEHDPLSVAVGEWVIDAALIQIERWLAVGLHMKVSVNVGSLQLQRPDFAARLGVLLAAHPAVAPQDLEIEILETSALQDMAQVGDVMLACQALGVRFALDDFGTGYSSLTYLKRLPAEQIKIDQSFIRDMLNDQEDLAIVRGVIGLAEAFHREVIAEGVETLAHGTQLLRLGCELAQGYGIARPMPAADVPGWVATWRPDAAWSSNSVDECEAPVASHA